MNLLASIWILGMLSISESVKYTPDWPSLDSRPLPSWYDKAKIGIFMHFGPYSVPSFIDEWFWIRWHGGNKDAVKFMEDNYRPDFAYQDFGSQLSMEFFDPLKFAQLVNSSGANYFVFTSKHHDGFTNFPSPYTFGWNSMDIGPKRDVVGDLKKAFDTYPNLHFGLYYSLFEWLNPMYLKDKANKYSTTEYVDKKMIPELKYLIENYKPDLLWSDGDWEASPDYWKSKEILAWLYNDSPSKDTIVTNDRWGKGTREKHGGYYSGPDRFHPGTVMKHKFEDAFTADRHSWGYTRTMNIQDILSIDEIISTLVSVVSCNGNVLFNIGPTKEGTIIPVFQERLLQMGQWLKLNGEAIYESRPWKYQKDSSSKSPSVWYTSKGNTIYGVALGWPENNTLTLGNVKTSSSTQINLLGWNKPLTFTQTSSAATVLLPDLAQYLNACGQQCFVGQGFTLKFTNLSNA